MDDHAQIKKQNAAATAPAAPKEGSAEWNRARAQGWNYTSEVAGGSNPYVNYSAHLYTDPWEKEKQLQKNAGEPLYKSFSGRVATRLVSRGVIGSAFYTAGILALRSWDPYLPYDEMPLVHKGLTRIAKGCDYVFGKPIALATEGACRLAGMEREAAREWGVRATSRLKNRRSTFEGKLHGVFEEAKNKASARGKGHATVPVYSVNGRTLGEEMVGITFDFAMGSAGDALGREIMSLFDPNYHKSWIKDGRVDFGEMMKCMGKSAWRIVSYNQMEDWAAALPYVYQMRAQRKILSKIWPGGKFSMDHNVGAMVLDKEYNLQHSHLGLSATELQLRFMGYNFYTLMFRDMYNHCASKLHQWQDGGYHAPHFSLPDHPIDDAAHAISETVKYTAKSFMKSMLYMAPAVPFFWITRAPQYHNSCLFVQEGNGILSSEQILPAEKQPGKEPEFKVVQADGKTRTSGYSRNFFGAQTARKATEQPQVYFGEENITNKVSGWLNKDFDPLAQEHAKTWFEKLLFPIGRLNVRINHAFDQHIVKPLSETWVVNGILDHIKQDAAWRQVLSRPDNASVFTRTAISNTYMNAALSYTPYMIAKYEAANHVDMPLFDAAAYRFLDGIHHLNWKDFKEGAKDMAQVVVRGPISEGTIREADKPRGLINSTYESTVSENKKQAALRQERAMARALAAKHAGERKKDGWAATHRMAQAQAAEQGAPDGVTLH
jgi:hypothetical protein